jgi:hypothetical protein
MTHPAERIKAIPRPPGLGVQRVCVSQVGGKSASLEGSPNVSTNSSARAIMDTDLTPDQEAEARRIFEALKQSAEADLMALARLLASKATGEIFGATEFAVRDRVQRNAALYY